MPKIEIINPHGMCGGVNAAIAKALKAKNAWCLHAIVHNELVTAKFKARGFRFVEHIEDVPEGATVVLPAHGVAPSVWDAAKARRLNVIDTTCPSVAKVHRTVRRFVRDGLPVVLIGDPVHAETAGIFGEVEALGGSIKVGRTLAEIGSLMDWPRIGVAAQTSMNADEVHAIVNDLRRQHDAVLLAQVCTATKERQDAVRRFCASGGDRMLLVLGSATSANTGRLVEVAESAGVPARLAGDIETVRALKPELFAYAVVGITSGASTPESFFSDVADFLSCDIIHRHDQSMEYFAG